MTITTSDTQFEKVEFGNANLIYFPRMVMVMHTVVASAASSVETGKKEWGIRIGLTNL